MRGARQEQRLKKNKAQETCKMREKHKLEAGECLDKNATAFAEVVPDSEDSDDDEDKHIMERKKKPIEYSRVLDYEMDMFSATLKELKDLEAELFDLEHEKLTFELEKYAEEQWRYRQERKNCIADNER